MSSKTDYKRLWRKANNKSISLANKLLRLENVIEGQIETIKGLRSGKIKQEQSWGGKK